MIYLLMKLKEQWTEKNIGVYKTYNQKKLRFTKIGVIKMITENVRKQLADYRKRRTDVKFGWEQPKLPYHNNMPFGSDLNGNVLENDKWDGVIHDYQTATPELILTCNGYFGGNGVGTIHIPIKYCPECGRKLGKEK